ELDRLVDREAAHGLARLQRGVLRRRLQREAETESGRLALTGSGHLLPGSGHRRQEDGRRDHGVSGAKKLIQTHLLRLHPKKENPRAVLNCRRLAGEFSSRQLYTFPCTFLSVSGPGSVP